MSIARDSHAPESARIAMIELLGQLGRAGDRAVLLELIAPAISQSIGLAAVAGLGHFKDDALATPLLTRCRTAAPVVRDRIVSLLCSRPAWARELVDALARHEVAPRELTPRARPAHRPGW